MKLIDLAAYAPDPRDVAELRWFYNERDGAMGLRSNAAGVISRLESPLSFGCGVVQSEMDERQVEAASRARLIQRSLDGIGEAHRDTLRCAYTLRGDAAHPDPLVRYRDLAGLVDGSGHARKVHEGSRSQRTLTEWLERIVRPGASLTARQLCGEVKRSAEARLTDAHRAYAGARRVVRNTPRRAG